MKLKTKLTFILFLACLSSFSQDNVIIRDINPANFNTDFTRYDQPTALYCGQLSEVAYWKHNNIDALCRKSQEIYPSEKINFIRLEKWSTNTQALLWCTKDFLVIAFRGTQPTKARDIITDVKFSNRENNPDNNEVWCNMPAGHAGFRKALIGLIIKENIFTNIDSIIKISAPDANPKKFPIYLTGHSLGSGISQLFMECLHFKGYNFAGAYHFAPPLAVSCSLNTYMKETYGNVVYNIVNFKDYIPRAGRNNVAHFGKFYRICENRLLYRETESYVKFCKKEYRKAFVYHKLINHLNAIRDFQNTDNLINERSEASGFECMGKGIEEINPCHK